MCRILYMETKSAIDPQPILRSFARMAQNSVEYQGHGWGCAWQTPLGWDVYWSIRPVWEDDFQAIPATQRLLVHARSAFRNQGIAIQNNMPFLRQDTVFVFNGELHGVRLREEGRIGAEKLFRFILRLQKTDLLTAVSKALPIIFKRSRYVSALNFIMANAEQTVLASFFNEREAYFTMHQFRSADRLLVCSEPLFNASQWKPIVNGTIEEIYL